MWELSFSYFAFDNCIIIFTRTSFCKIDQKLRNSQNLIAVKINSSQITSVIYLKFNLRY